MLTTIGGKPTVLASAYCSPNPPSDCSALKLLMENILKAWNYCQQNNINNFVVLGDFNARNRMWGDKLDNPRGRLLKEFTHKWDCEISAPTTNTFITRTGGSVIDLCLSFGSSKQHLCPPWIDTTDLHELFTGAPERGHIPVISHYRYNTDKSASQGKGCNTVYNYEDADWPKWSKYLDSLLSNKLLDIDNDTITHTPEELYRFFLESVNDSSNRYIPHKRVCSHSKPYWSPTLTTLSDKLRTAQKTYLSNSTLSNKEVYITCRDEFKAALLKEKNDWIHTKLEKLNARDCKLFWKTYSRQFLSQDENFISNLCSPDTNKLAHTEADKEKLLFETFFSGKHLINKEFDEQHYQDTVEQLSDIKDQSFEGSDALTDEKQQLLEFLNDQITVEEVISSITDQQASGKSRDGDKIHPKMLKCLSETSCKYLTLLYNTCFETGVWPWNSASIVFIKKADKETYLCPGSYRPLTLSAYVGKIFERVLERRLRCFCGQEGIIDEAQEGFLPARNTTRYLYKMLSSLNEAKRRKIVALLLLLDFEKAFDSVPIPCMLIKLFDYGVRGKFLGVIHSFLTGRKVKLKVNDHIGPERLCELIGLPQGAVLSPLLFIIYIADLFKTQNLPQTIRDCTQCFKYADDGSVSVIGDSLLECQQNMQIVCNYIADWCKKWRMVVNCNVNKTEAIILKSANCSITDTDRSSLPPLNIGGEQLLYVKKSKVLGLIIDEDLSFLPHANKVLQSCWYTWFRLSDKTTRKRGLNSATLTLLFKTVVLTKLFYAAPVWLDMRLETFKDFFARIMLKILGSQYYVPKQLGEVLIGLPPTDLLVKEITIKFILKSLMQEDNMGATILQIEETPGHIYYKHTILAKQFLLWKRRGDTTPGSTMRAESFMNMPYRNFVYTKVEIKEYTCQQWDSMLKYDMNGITNEDPFNIEPSHGKEELSSMVDTMQLLSCPIIGRECTRLKSSNIMDFLHGRCVRFQNFAYSVLKYNKSMLAPICLECCTLPDSVYHKLYECEAYSDCETVKDLRKQLEEVAKYEFNHHLPLIFTYDRTLRGTFFALADTVCKESMFDDEFLTHTWKKKVKETKPKESGSSKGHPQQTQ